MINIRYIHPFHNGVSMHTGDKASARAASRLIDEIVTATDSDTIDFTIAAPGQEPLSPGVVDKNVVAFLCRLGLGVWDVHSCGDISDENRISIDDVAHFMHGVDFLDLTPFGWERLDALFDAHLDTLTAFGSFSIEHGPTMHVGSWDGPVHESWTVMDGLVDFASALVPHLDSSLPRTRSRIKAVFMARHKFVDFAFDGCDATRKLLAEVSFEKVLEHSLSGAPLSFRTTRYSRRAKYLEDVVTPEGFHDWELVESDVKHGGHTLSCVYHAVPEIEFHKRLY
jgi:hypothetical protein